MKYAILIFILLFGIGTTLFRPKNSKIKTRMAIATYTIFGIAILLLLFQEKMSSVNSFFHTIGIYTIEAHFMAAILIFAISVMLAYQNRKNSSLSKISILLAGLFISIVTLVYPLYDQYENLFQRAVYSILYSIQCIYVGQDFELIQTQILEHQASTIYSLLINFMFLLAPIFTTGVIITLLESFMHQLKYAVESIKPWKKEIHIFSHINKESVMLAESINHPGAILLFCNEKEEEIKESLKIRIRKIEGITIDSSELDIRVTKRKTCFYEISEDEIKNLDNAMKLIEKYTNKKNVKVTIFSTRKEAEMMIDATNREMEVSLVNKNRYALYHLLEQRPMIKWSKNAHSSVLVMGEHSRILETIKMVLWSMQLDGEELEINVVDNDAEKLKSMFYHQCPSLKEEKYVVNFYQADIETEELDDVIDRNCQNTNYIILAMKEDRLNIQTAIYLREHFLYLDKENYRNQPPIHIWLNDEIKGIQELGINDRNYIVPGQESKKVTYGFYPFGTTEQIYSEVSILNTKLDEFALMMHLANVGVLEKTKEEQKKARQTYRNRENTRKYAITCAIHMKYSLYTKGIDLFKKEITKELVQQAEACMEQEENVQSLMRSDIRMWNTFWRTEGYRRITFEEAEVYCKNKVVEGHQHTIAKLNPCLTDLDEFEENEIQLERIRGRKIKLISVERNYVMFFPKVLTKLIKDKKKKSLP